jgi:hypothetical protein
LNLGSASTLSQNPVFEMASGFYLETEFFCDLCVNLRDCLFPPEGGTRNPLSFLYFAKKFLVYRMKTFAIKMKNNDMK